jgi:hypothetical protein
MPLRLHQASGQTPSTTPVARSPVAVPAIDPAWVVRPDAAATLTATLRARKRCSEEVLTEAEWAECPAVARGNEPPSDGVAPRDKQAGYARATARKDAIKDYKSNLGSPFPGLRCSFGRDC